MSTFSTTIDFVPLLLHVNVFSLVQGSKATWRALQVDMNNFDNPPSHRLVSWFQNNKLDGFECNLSYIFSVTIDSLSG